MFSGKVLPCDGRFYQWFFSYKLFTVDNSDHLATKGGDAVLEFFYFLGFLAGRFSGFTLLVLLLPALLLLLLELF